MIKKDSKFKEVIILEILTLDFKPLYKVEIDTLRN
jgi:hypothetical protein